MKRYFYLLLIFSQIPNVFAVRSTQGFPAKIIGVPSFQFPVIGNIDSDEEKEILFFASGRLECWKSDGSICSWAPFELKEKVEIIYSPTLADVDLDGKMEILFGSVDGNFFIMNGEGKILQGFPKKFGDGYISTPSSFDLDRDGKPDICFGTSDKRFYCIKSDGSVLKGFPVKTDSPITTSGSFAYFGENNELSIAFGCENGSVYVVNSSGRLLKNFPFKTHYVISGMPVFADINDDGKNELIVASQDYSIYAIDVKGKLLEGFPVETGYRIHGSPAIADVDLDGFLDIIVGSTDGKLYVMDYRGKMKNGFPYDTGSKIFSSPVVGDINCDGSLEIVFAAIDGRIYALDNKGKTLEDFPYVIGGELKSSPIIDDIDNDQRIEMLFLSPKSELHSLVAVNKCDKKSKLVWQMAGRDPHRTGRYFPNSARIYNVGFESERVYSNEPLKLKYSYFHLDGRPEQNTKIYWYKNGNRVEELDGKRIIEPKYFKKHDRLYAEIQDEENFKEYGRGIGAKIVKSPEIQIRNVVPDAPQIEIYPSEVFTGNKVDIRIIKDSKDYDNDKVVYKYSYFKNNRRLEYSEDQNYISGSDVFKNDRISVIVTPYDGEEIGKSASIEFVVKNTAPSPCEFDIVPQSPTIMTEIEVKITRHSTDIDKDTLTYIYNLWLDGVFIPYDFKNNKFAKGFFKKNQEVRVGVKAFDGELYSPEVYKSVKIYNSPPLSPKVVLLPKSPTVETELRALIEIPSIDYDGDPINYRYTWYKNGSVVNNVDGSVLHQKYFKKGDIIKVEVVPNDNTSDGGMATAETKILNSIPTIPIAHMEKSILTTNEEAKIIIDKGSTDLDGDNIVYKTEWYQNGKRIQNLDDKLDSKGFIFKKHEKWNVSIYAFDGVDKSQSNNLAFEVKNSAPSKPEVTFEIAPVDKGKSLKLKIVKPSVDIDGDKVEYRIRWFVNGREIEKSRDKVELLPEFFAKNQNVIVRIVPFDGEIEGDFVELSTYIKNSPPVSPTVEIEPKHPTVLSDLLCKMTRPISDLDGDQLKIKYVWYKNSVMFLTTEESNLRKGYFRKGDKVYCEVVGTDGEFFVSSKSSEISIVNSKPERPQIKIIPDEPQTNDELLCTISTNSIDVDNDKITYTFSWKKNDKPFKENVTKISSNEVTRGTKYACLVYAYDGELKSDYAEAVVSVKNKRPLAPVVRLEPAYPFEGDELKCNIIKPAEDIEKDEVKYKFFWYKNGQLLNFASTSVAIPGRLVKKGDIYSCEVVPYDYDGDGEKGYSNSVIVLEKR
ncbi:MAG: FG-GAP-like repeat-containing protein [Deltaproteobacteria bacterium]|nr:FG-GAP-like repeat-containing protein [Deltaproteobacteria bacterium]